MPSRIDGLLAHIAQLEREASRLLFERTSNGMIATRPTRARRAGGISYRSAPSGATGSMPAVSASSATCAWRTSA